MNLSFLLSGSVHIVMIVCLMFLMKPSDAKTKAVYTIDFIGAAAAQPARYGEPDIVAAPKNDKSTSAKKAEPEIKTTIPKPKKKAPKAKPEYNSADQISKKPKKTKAKPVKKDPPPKPVEKIKLSKPSILGDVESSNIDVSDLHNLGSSQTDNPGNTVRASFTNFPYPWYITQVRNSLWREWSKRMPKNIGLSTLVSFNIDKYGAVYGVQIERQSGDDAYDYAATTSANNSAPYPPLPKDFPRDILTVTVEFKNEE